MRRSSLLDKKRLGLVGPVLPYRGGIARHTTMLHRNLSPRCDLLTISFKRLYPGWLYPGQSDREPGYEAHREEGAHYLLDSLNPLTWLKACRLLAGHSPRLVLIPWWTVFWTPCFALMVGYLRRRKIPVLFLCHNVVDHESRRWKTALSRFGLSRGSFYITHTSSEAEALKRLIPKADVAIRAHPIYNQFPPAKGSLPRRARLELLFFGIVRPYKGLDVLVEAMKLLEDEDVFLSVVGEWWGQSESLRRALEEAGPRRKMEVVDRFVSEQEAAEYFGRADVVVLPYKSSTGSGIAGLAYHYGKPVVATDVGGLSEVVEDGSSGRLAKAGDSRSLAGAIRWFLSNDASAMREGVERAGRRMTWGGLVEAVLSFAEREAGPKEASGAKRSQGAAT